MSIEHTHTHTFALFKYAADSTRAGWLVSLPHASTQYKLYLPDGKARNITRAVASDATHILHDNISMSYFVQLTLQTQFNINTM